MAQRRPERTFSQLGLRIRSAALFAPAALAAVHFGPPWYEALILLTGILMVWEWSTICASGEYGYPAWGMSAGIVAALAAMIAGMSWYAIPIVAATTVCVLLLARGARYAAPVYFATGTIVVGLFGIAFLWLRSEPGSGREIVLWLVCAVWFTDAGGYIVGRMVGGPRLAPRISPNKTWAGLAGGIVFCAVWSAVWLKFGGERDLALALFAAVCAAILAQTGDLSVSFVKRRFGVKDSSNLIPGHGGVLDRIDGMLLTGPALALFVVLVNKGWIEW